MNDTIEVYCVVTESAGKRTPGPKHKRPFSGCSVAIEEKQYSVLATSLEEAVQIVKESNAHVADEVYAEFITKAWKLTTITAGLSGSRYSVSERTK